MQNTPPRSPTRTALCSRLIIFIHSLDKAMQHTILLFVAFLLLTCPGFSESGGAAWLRYARLDPVVASRYASLPAVLITLDHSTVSQSAQTELLLGIRGMLGRTLRIEAASPTEPAIVVGTVSRSKPSMRALVRIATCRLTPMR